MCVTGPRAFDRFLAEGGPAHVPRYAIEVERGIDLVHDAGGVAVIAHPWGRGREHVLPPEFLQALRAEHGLDGIEVDHQDHDAETRARLRRLAAELVCWRPAPATTTAPARSIMILAATPPIRRSTSAFPWSSLRLRH